MIPLDTDSAESIQDALRSVSEISRVTPQVAEKFGFTSGDNQSGVVRIAEDGILDATARKLGLAPEKVIVTVDQHANTSAASVPLALDHAVRDGRIKPGDLVVMEAMGGGFTWGACLLQL